MWFLYLVLLTSVSVVSSIVSKTISNIFHMKWSICDIKMMSRLYVSIILNIIIGSSMYGYIFFVSSEFEDLQSKIISTLLGISIYVLMCIFIDMRKYNNLKKSLEILNITSNDELEEFIKQQE